MEQWVGIALGLIVVIVLLVLFMSQSSPMESTPAPPQDVLPAVPKAPQTFGAEPSPVISPPVMVSNTQPMSDSFPSALSFTSFNMTSELDDKGEKTDYPKIVLPTAPEDAEMDHASMYSEWSK